MCSTTAREFFQKEQDVRYQKKEIKYKWEAKGTPRKVTAVCQESEKSPCWNHVLSSLSSLPLLRLLPWWPNARVISLIQILTSTLPVLLNSPSIASWISWEHSFHPPSSTPRKCSDLILCWALEVGHVELEKKYGDTDSTNCSCCLSSSCPHLAPPDFPTKLSLIFPRTHSWPCPLVTSVGAFVKLQILKPLYAPR